MFKHILLPTDGSETSKSAIQKCITFAKENGAKVTGLHVIPEYQFLTYQTEMLADTREQYAKDSILHAKKILAEIETAAKEAGVECETLYVTSEYPHEAIVKAANDEQCDLIIMATHGRKGVQRLFLGSETQKVLTLSPIPVLVFR